MKILNI